MTSKEALESLMKNYYEMCVIDNCNDDMYQKFNNSSERGIIEKDLDKLSQLEEILKKYTITNLEELDKILDENLKQFTQMGYGDRTWEDYHKIEEELGIDLITLFRALKNGFYVYKDNHVVEIKSHKGNCGVMSFYASYDSIIAEDVFEQQYIYLLKDYGKTWALTEKELENE